MQSVHGELICEFVRVKELRKCHKNEDAHSWKNQGIVEQLQQRVVQK